MTNKWEKDFNEKFCDPACIADNCSNPVLLNNDTNEIKQFISNLLKEVREEHFKEIKEFTGDSDEAWRLIYTLKEKYDIN